MADRTLAEIFRDHPELDFNELSARVERQESGGNPNAVSSKGAIGPMQTLPTTLEDPGYGVTPAANKSTHELRRVGKDYLKAMLEKYNGDQALALAAYNHGPGNVDAWLKAGGKPEDLPKETRGYVENILGPAPDYTDKYNTPLPKDQEAAFQAWRSKLPKKLQSEYDYDLKGAYLAGVSPSDDDHMVDTFKKPNHPYFSDQSQYARVPGARPGHWNGDTFVPYSASASPEASQEVPAQEHVFDVNGVPFKVTFPGDRQQAADFLGAKLKEQPDLLPRKAIEAGLKFDWQTGKASEYSTVEKLAIGAEHTFVELFHGAQQLDNELRRYTPFLQYNAQRMADSKDQTDYERELYSYINKPGQGLNATDVGSMVAIAPLLWGGGILGVAGKLGLESAAEAQGTGEDGLMARGEKGAKTAAAAALLGLGGKVVTGVGGFALEQVASKMGGWGNLGKYAGTLLLDSATTGLPFLTMGRMINGALRSIGGESGEAASRNVAGRGASRSENLSSWDRTGHAGPPGSKMPTPDTIAGKTLALAREWLGGAKEVVSDRANQALAKIALDVQQPEAALLAKEELARRTAVTYAKRAAQQRAEAEKIVDEAVTKNVPKGAPEYLRRPMGATNENLTPPRVPPDRMQRPTAGGTVERVTETPLIDAGIDLEKLGLPNKTPPEFRP